MESCDKKREKCMFYAKSGIKKIPTIKQMFWIF